MLVLGIDPGSRVTGYGLVRKERGRLRLVHAGCVKTDPQQPMAARLATIHAGLSHVLATYTPDEVAIEGVFHHKNAQSALTLGHARGVALLAAGQHGYEPFEYNPMVVKQTVGATGRADKKAVAKMVKMLLGVDLPGPADVTDAVAIAITHCAHARVGAR